RRRGVDDVAAHRGNVADLMAADDLGALDQRLQRALEAGLPLQPAVGHPRAERDRAADVDGVEAGHAVQAHDVLRPELAAAHLDEEVGAPGQEAAVGAEPRAQLDGLAHGGGLVVLEVHGRYYAPSETRLDNVPTAQAESPHLST